MPDEGWGSIFGSRTTGGQGASSPSARHRCSTTNSRPGTPLETVTGTESPASNVRSGLAPRLIEDERVKYAIQSKQVRVGSDGGLNPDDKGPSLWDDGDDIEVGTCSQAVAVEVVLPEV